MATLDAPANTISWSGNKSKKLFDSVLLCITSGTDNVLLGNFTGSNTSTGIANLTGTDSGRIIIGNTNAVCAQVQVAWTVNSDIRDKCIFGPVPHGKGFLANVTPITYAFKNRETGEITDSPNKKRYGFSAQEILSLEGENGVIVSDENTEKLQLTSDYIIPILVNAIKELTRDYEELKAEIEELKKRV